MLRARATWVPGTRGCCEDRASSKCNTDSFCSTQTFPPYRPGAKMGEFDPRGRLGSTPGHTPAPVLARISPLGCPDTKAADGGALGRRNRPITGLVAYCSICPCHYLSLIRLHFYLDHGCDEQVRSQRTHVLQPARGIFAHLRLPTTLPLLQDPSGPKHENRHRAANADRTRGPGCFASP